MQRGSSSRSFGPIDDSASSRVFYVSNRGLPILSLAGRFMGTCLTAVFPGIVSLKDLINDNLESSNAYKEKSERFNYKPPLFSGLLVALVRT